MPQGTLKPLQRRNRPWAPDFADVIEEDLERRCPVDTSEYKYLLNSLHLTSVTTDTTLTKDDDLVLVDCTYGDVTISLPTASSVPGKEYRIKKTDSTKHEVIIDPYGTTEEIDGDTELRIDHQYNSPCICSDGSNWYLI